MSQNWDGTKWIRCPYCEAEVLVYWGSFMGCGKQCPDCSRVIRHSDKVVVLE